MKLIVRSRSTRIRWMRVAPAARVDFISRFSVDWIANGEWGTGWRASGAELSIPRGAIRHSPPSHLPRLRQHPVAEQLHPAPHHRVRDIADLHVDVEAPVAQPVADAPYLLQH